MNESFHMVNQFLKSPTPQQWVNAALNNWPIILIDHAHCEKKAAASALGFIYRYPNHSQLLQQISRFAREELRHFEQVLKLLKECNIQFRHLTPSRYATELRRFVRQREPEKLIDSLLISAFIEARSCERFLLLANQLPMSQMRDFYQRLSGSEGRHFIAYLDSARKVADDDLDDRINEIVQFENNLILTEDPQLRFHSGLPRS